MKRFLLLFSFLTVVLAASAGSEEKDFKKANGLYEEGYYDSARVEYTKLEDAGFYSSELYQNLGNTYFKLDDIAHSIWYFERALKLSPGNEEIIHNLKLANRKVTDKKENNNVDESVQLSDWVLDTAGGNASSWGTWSIIWSCLTFCFLGAFLFLKKPLFKRITFFSSMFGIVLIGLSAWIAWLHDDRVNTISEAIIFEPSAELMTEPTVNSSVAFVLHEGTKVKLESETTDWYEVTFMEGRVGWIKKEFVKEI